MVVLFGSFRGEAFNALLPLLAAGLLCLGPSPSEAFAQQSSGQDSESKYGGRVSYAENSSVSVFNPYQLGEPSGVSDRLFSLMYEGLVHYDYQREKVVPVLANDWIVGKKEITFYLRKDVQWHDGEPFTAEDVVFTFRYILKAGSNRSARRLAASLVQSVDQGPSQHIVTFQLNRTPSNIAREFSGFWVIPKHRFNDQMLPKDESTPLRDAPVGTGAYEFEEDLLDGSIKLTSFQDHWDGKAHIANTQMKRIFDPTTTFQQAKGGNIELIIETPPGQVGPLEETGRFTFEVSPSLSFDAFAYDNAHPVLGKRKVRRALTHAVDRRSLLENFYAGKGQVLGGPVVPQQGYYNPNVQTLKHNPEKARSLLKEAGYVDRDEDGTRETPDGTTLSFDVFTLVPEAASSTVNQNVAESYTSSLGKVGIEASIAPRPKEEYREIVFNEGDFNIAWVQWEFDPNYDIGPLFRSSETEQGGDNIVNYKNEKIDKKFEEFVREDDPERRRSLIYEVQKIISKDVPYTFLYSVEDYTAVHRRVVSTRIDPYYFFSYYDDWYIPSGYR